MQSIGGSEEGLVQYQTIKDKGVDEDDGLERMPTLGNGKTTTRRLHIRLDNVRRPLCLPDGTSWSPSLNQKQLGTRYTPCEIVHTSEQGIYQKVVQSLLLMTYSSKAVLS